MGRRRKIIDEDNAPRTPSSEASQAAWPRLESPHEAQVRRTDRRKLGRRGRTVHDAQTRPVGVLPLAEVEERNHGRLLVLGRVARDDLVGLAQVGLVELERDLGEEDARRARSAWRGERARERSQD